MLKRSVTEVIHIRNEKMELFSQRALYWKAEETLLLADLHLGKVNHFRKAGLPVPVKVNEKNVEVLLEILQLTKPARVIFLGDLFHSHYNEEWEVFGQLLKNFPTVSFELVVGNHDILSDHQYQKLGIIMHQELQLGPFLLTHHPLENYSGELYNLAGHIHPGARLVGKGRQRLTLPCFHFGKQQGLLPAFGSFTGLARIVPKKEDQVFIIVENKILKV